MNRSQLKIGGRYRFIVAEEFKDGIDQWALHDGQDVIVTKLLHKVHGVAAAAMVIFNDEWEAVVALRELHEIPPVTKN